MAKSCIFDRIKLNKFKMANNVEVKSNWGEHLDQANRIEERMNDNECDGRKNGGAHKNESDAGTQC